MHEEDAGHKCGDGKSVQAELGDDIVHYHNKRTRGAAYLDGASAEERHHESAYYGCDKSYCGAYARCDTESDSERQGYDAYHDACDNVGFEARCVIVAQAGKELGVEVDSLGRRYWRGFAD